MSRVAKNPVAIPGGVEVTISAAELAIKGPLGTIRQAISPAVTVEREGDMLVCKAREGVANAVAMSGTIRSLV
ncbi:MAG: 50S ribosomal protein L6, partial [Betaproteobacteria bacterium HGW-Betaproteobacteria-21]